MPQRPPARFIAAAGGFLLLGGACTPRAAPTGGDIVLVVIDTLRADHTARAHLGRDTTPNLDGVARVGTRYTQARAHSGWTLPAMGSLLTGLLPSQHGAVRAASRDDRFGRVQGETLSEALRAKGYRTGAVVNNAFLDRDFGLARGFTHYDQVGASWSGHRPATQTVDAALRWLDADPSPAFLLVHLMEPHLNYAPPPSTSGRFRGPGPGPIPVPFADSGVMHDLRSGARIPDAEQQQWIAGAYDEEIAAADIAVGALIDGLSRRPRADQSWLAITGDHGEELWDHGGFEHGHSLEDELLRVPMVIRGPGMSAGHTVAEPVGHVDLHATLRAAGGATLSDGWGRNLREGGPDLYAAAPHFSEGTLYGPHLARVQVATNALVVDLTSGATELQGPARGTELADQERDRLRTLLDDARGGMGLPVATRLVARPSDRTREQLESLGYLDGGR